MRTHGFGIDEDSPYHIWHNWWLKFSLFDLKQNPLRTNYIFFPQEISLIYDANSFVFAALTLPLQLFMSTITASNIIFLLSFVLSGLSMYLLTRSLTSNSLISFVSGLIFAFSPYTLAQALDGHTNLTTTWIIPLYTLCLLKTLDRTRQSRPNLVLPVLTGLTASLQFYNDFTYTTFLIIETCLILIFFIFWNLYYQPKSVGPVLKRTLTASTVILLTVAILSGPLLWEIGKVSQTGFRIGAPLWAQNEWAADLKAFFHPPDRSTFLKNLSFTSVRGTVEGTVFPGYTLLIILFIYILIRLRKSNDQNQNRPPVTWLGSALWTFLSLSFFSLSLGPVLRSDGRFQFDFLDFQNIIWPLPWLILHKIPLIGETQEPARINPLLMLSLSLLASICLQNLLARFNSNRMKQRLIILTSVLILLEYLPIPFPTTDLRSPNIYQEIARDRGNFSVLTLPLGFNSGNIALGRSPIGSLQYFQVVHQHPSFRGTVARLPAATFDYYRQLPLIKILINPSAPPDANDLDKELVVETIKNQLRVKYIVLHKDKFVGDEYNRTLNLLNLSLDLELMGEDERVVAYKLR